MAICKGVWWIATAAILCSFLTLGQCADLPCRTFDVGVAGRSVVCVCNSTYCDTITRENPERGTYVVYTSSIAGQRFQKSFGLIGTQSDTKTDDDPEDSESEPKQSYEHSPYEDEVDGGMNVTRAGNNVVLDIYPDKRYQFIVGFGGSVTDAAAINWRKLSDATQQNLIDSYFGPKGLEYNLIRVPIGGSDFSVHPYAYAEEPWHDYKLSNFSLSSEDYILKLPMIKRAQKVATDDIQITATTWSPPVWMKTNEMFAGYSHLKPQYYQTYADYHLRFIEEYDKENVKIWAITTTNEPINGIIAFAPFNSLGFFPSEMGRWVADNLGPTIRGSRYNSTLILAVDDQRYLLHFYLSGMEREDPKSIDYIDGIAVHWYGNFVPGQLLTTIHNRYPSKILLATEACEGSLPWHIERPVVGSWARARRYVSNILEDLNNFVSGWMDWNLCLDPQGGPNWADNFVDSPVLVYGDKDEFIKQPMFYAMGHFSKFIPRGARRLHVSHRSNVFVENVALIKPDGNIVIVLLNRRRREINVRVRISRMKYIELTMEPESVKTIEVNSN